MKTKPTLCMLILLVLSLGILPGCHKDKNDQPQTTLPEKIRAFIPQYILDTFKRHGFTVHTGTKPPDLQGIFMESPVLCTYDNSGDGDAGQTFDNYKYRFYDQDDQKLTIKLDFKDVTGTDKATGVGAFITGNGNSFSIFEHVKGTSDGVTYESVEIYSGVMTSKGIQDFQDGFFMKSKGPDPEQNVTDVGTTRIFIDNDGLTDKVNTY